MGGGRLPGEQPPQGLQPQGGQQQQQQRKSQSPQRVENSLVVLLLSRSPCMSTSTNRRTMTYTTSTTCITMKRTRMHGMCLSMLTIRTTRQCLPPVPPPWQSASPPAPPSLPSNNAPTSSA